MVRTLRIVAAALALAGCMSDEPRDRGAPALREASPAPQIRSSAPPDREPAVALRHEPAVGLRGDVEPIGAGTLTAAAVEAYMDGQEKELRSELRGSGVVVGRKGDDLTLGIRSDSLFAPNAVVLTTRGAELLGAIARIVHRYDSTQLSVSGYTDTTGTAQRNLDVSQKRADAVAEVLTKNGVDRGRMNAKGFGQTDLRIPTGLDIDEPRNRRIEIDIAPRVKA